MYKGVGLQTTRGTGVNCYVQRNLSSLIKLKRKIELRAEDDIRKLESIIYRNGNEHIFQNCKSLNKCFQRKLLGLDFMPLSTGSKSINILIIRGFKTKSRSISNRLGQRSPNEEKTSSTFFNLSEDLKLKFSSKQTDKLNSLLDPKLTQDEAKRIKIAFAEGYLTGDSKKSSPNSKIKIIRDLLGIVVVIVIMSAFMREFSGGRHEVFPEEIEVTFDDVKGAEEAKQELQEVVEFLKNPQKFSALGGKLPKGVLLVGPPGTGKTLLARAVAGEANVPFFHAAGPEFDEIMVGQGARRVRDLFQAAKVRAPCVVFIDEIDSVGGKRTTSVLHPYANQTINQLLTEMDGFRQNEGVVVLGATNRRDDLDRALLRPGRFDVEVTVRAPDMQGRKDIFDLYLAKIKYAKDVDSGELARRTTGFTGADIENMVNQAALRAAIDGETAVYMRYFEGARDKLLLGPQRKNRIPDEEYNKVTAYHEGGHALVALYTNDSLPLHKVTIIARGESGGHTSYIPDKEVYQITKAQMLAQLDVAMGGRAAEEVVFGTDKVSTGASSDLKVATSIATQMIKYYGMSDKVGLRSFDEKKDSLVNIGEVSDSTNELIDEEIRRLLQESYLRAKKILETHSKEHKLLAEALLKHETLDAEEVRDVIQGIDPKKDKDGEKRKR